MTNMRGFAGLRGDWHYSRGWLTLLICITHQSRSQQRRADKPHMQPRHMSENPACADSTQTRIFTQSSSRIPNDTPNKDIWFMYKDCSRQTKACHQLYGNARFTASDVQKYKIPLSCCWQNCYSFPSESGFKDQQLAVSNGERSGLQIYRVTNFKGSRPVMRAKEPMIGSHCHPATITTARGRKAHFFFLIIGSLPPPPPALRTLSTMPLKNMISFFEAFEWLQTFF